MVFVIEECVKRLHSINGSSQCITDMTQWMEENSEDAKRIVEMIRDMIPTSSYQTKLHLFYLANSILVRERSNGAFFYTPYLADLLPYMIEQSLTKIENPDIAQRILGVLQLWKNKHTMGRSMTAKVLKSIPVSVFSQYPQFRELNKHSPEETKEAEQKYLSTTSIEAPKPKPLSPLEDIRSFLESFPGEDETATRSRRQVEMKLSSLRKIRDYDPTTMDEDAEEYEVVIDKSTVRLLCEEEESRCRKEQTLLSELSDLLDKAAQQNETEADEDRELLSQCSVSMTSITKNNELLFTSSAKRPGPELEEAAKRVEF
ncbi:hypothetical protein WA538_003056 [Blastocystis sp. DL]